MKTTKRITIAALLVLAMLATPLLAAPGEGRGKGQGGPVGGQFQGRPVGGGQFQGGPGQGMGGRGGAMPLLRMLRALDLTEAQQADVKTLTEQAKEGMTAAQQAKQEATKALHEAVVAGTDTTMIRGLAAAIGQAIGDEAVLKVELMTNIKALLTPEQLTKLEEVQQKMKDRAAVQVKDQGEAGKRLGKRDGAGNGEGPKGPGNGNGRRGGQGRRGRPAEAPVEE